MARYRIGFSIEVEGDELTIRSNALKFRLTDDDTGQQIDVDTSNEVAQKMPTAALLLMALPVGDAVQRFQDAMPGIHVPLSKAHYIQEELST